MTRLTLTDLGFCKLIRKCGQHDRLCCRIGCAVASYRIKWIVRSALASQRPPQKCANDKGFFTKAGSSCAASDGRGGVTATEQLKRPVLPAGADMRLSPGFKSSGLKWLTRCSRCSLRAARQQRPISFFTIRSSACFTDKLRARPDQLLAHETRRTHDWRRMHDA